MPQGQVRRDLYPCTLIARFTRREAPERLRGGSHRNPSTSRSPAPGPTIEHPCDHVDVHVPHTSRRGASPDRLFATITRSTASFLRMHRPSCRLHQLLCLGDASTNLMMMAHFGGQRPSVPRAARRHSGLILARQCPAGHGGYERHCLLNTASPSRSRLRPGVRSRSVPIAKRSARSCALAYVPASRRRRRGRPPDLCG